MDSTKRELMISVIENARMEAGDTMGSMNGGMAAWYADKLLEAGVTPVVHGEWLLRHEGYGHYWECSVCHKNPCIYVTEDTKYCPNCGAKMDGSGHGN